MIKLSNESQTPSEKTCNHQRWGVRERRIVIDQWARAYLVGVASWGRGGIVIDFFCP